MEDHEDKAGALEKFKEEMAKQALNKKNVQKFVDAYMNRVDITGKLAAELRCDALLVVGSKSSQSAAAEYMHSHMDKVRWYRVYQQVLDWNLAKKSIKITNDEKFVKAKYYKSPFNLTNFFFWQKISKFWFQSFWDLKLVGTPCIYFMFTVYILSCLF